jgi:predicted unusual protein kinase regulating ubiquinone biosynthesis (AarF/ABC1/UbiB family)
LPTGIQPLQPNYRTEARQAYTLAENARGDRYEINPRVIASLTSRHVLRTELLEGVPVIELIEAIRDGNASFLNRFRAKGYDLALVARSLMWNTLNQVYVSGYFHADPHPANLIVLPGNAIGYVDFGIVGKLSDDLRDSLRFFARHLFAGEVDTAVSELMRWIPPSLQTDVAGAREELRVAMDRYLASKHASGHSSPFAEGTIYEFDILRVVHRHRMIMSPQIVMYLKAVLTVEAVIHQLVPTFDLLRHENLFFGRLIEQETFAALRPERIARALSDYGYRVRRVMEQVEELVAAPSRLEDLVFTVRRRLHWLAFAALALVTAFYFVIRSPRLEALRASYVGVSRGFWSLMFMVLVVLVLLMMVKEGRRLPRKRGHKRGRSRHPM